MRALTGRLAVLAVAVLTLAAEPAAATKTGRQLTPQDREDLGRISRYLNTLPPLMGRFSQVSVEPADNAQGIGGRTIHAQGTFYLKQPGRMRFEYDPPQKILFISDGRFVTIEDKEMESVDNYPLSRTPLHLLLKANLDLARDARIVAIRRTPGYIQVTVRGKKRGMEGQLSMQFSYPDLELLQWSVVDSRETRTTVTLRDVRKNVALKPELFRATDYDLEDWD